MTFAKVCGLKTEKDVEMAVKLGYDAIGIVLHEKSPRYMNAEDAKKLAAHAKKLKSSILTFAVAIDYAEVEEVFEDFDIIQISEHVYCDKLAYAGEEKPESVRFKYFIYDKSRGSGEFKGFPDWLKDYQDRTILAGGLTPYNVQGVITEFQPFGVDVSSGVELKKGIKDYGLMKEFIYKVKGF